MSSTTNNPGVAAYPNDALPVGTLLNGYRIISILGRGTFGITYLASEEHLDRRVAIKEYLPQEYAIRDGSNTVHPKSINKNDVFTYGRTSFLKEARTQVKFKHPNIVRVLTFFELNETAYIVMEHEEGISLDDYLLKYPDISQDELLSIFTPILEGLATVHEYGFIHRDIKPRNIIIRADHSPILLDFGSARDVVTNKTDELTRVLTHGYAPYEQENPAWSGQGPWTDIYALGATLYMAVMGYKPESASRRAAAYMSDSQDPYQSATTCSDPRYTQLFLQAIDNALEFYPKNRPQTLVEWLELLTVKVEEPEPEPVKAIPPKLISATRQEPDFTGGTVLPVEQDPDTQLDTLSSEPPQTNPLTWMIPLILFGFIAIGAGIYFLNPDSKQVQSANNKEAVQTQANATVSALHQEGRSDTAGATQTDNQQAAEKSLLPDMQGSANPGDLNSQQETVLALTKKTAPDAGLDDGAPNAENLPLSGITLTADSGLEIDEDKLIISFTLEKALKTHVKNIQRQPDGSVIIFLEPKQLFGDDPTGEFSADGLSLMNRLGYVFRNNLDFLVQITDRSTRKYSVSKINLVRNNLVSGGLPWARIKTIVTTTPGANGFSGYEFQLIPNLGRNTETSTL